MLLCCVHVIVDLSLALHMNIRGAALGDILKRDEIMHVDVVLLLNVMFYTNFHDEIV